MAARYTIEDSTFNDGSTCTAYYSLRIRKTTAFEWTVLPNQYESPIVVNNLDEGIEYQIGITRHCCDGSVALEVTDTFTTIAT